MLPFTMFPMLRQAILRVPSLVCLSALSLALAGCPHHIEQMAEKMIPPKDHKPAYMTSTVALSKYTQGFSSTATLALKGARNLGTLQNNFPAGLPSELATSGTVSGLPNGFPDRLPNGAPMDSATLAAALADTSLATTLREKMSEKMSDTAMGKEMNTGTNAMKNRADWKLPQGEVMGKSDRRWKKEREPKPSIEGGAQASSNQATKQPSNQNPSNQNPNSEATTPRLFTMQIRSVEDRRYPDEIELQAVVMDTAGRFVTGLVPQDGKDGSFRQYWHSISDSAAQTLALPDDFRVQEIRETLREPNAIAFVLDHSPSMGDARARRLQEAVQRTIRMVRPEDRIAVVKFTSKMYREVPLTGDSAVYRNQFKVDGLENYSGGTALYDGVIAGIEEVAKAPAGCKKTVIVFSDGGDNSSKAKLRDVYRLAYAKGVKVHTIGYGLTEEAPMQNIATTSGGRYYRIYTTREFPFVFADIYRSLKNYYRITYKPPIIAALHTARVNVGIAELGGLQLSAEAVYDRSLVTAVDTVGAMKFISIEFETGRADVRSESMPQLRELAKSLKQQPSITLEIRGHTDDRGGDDLNQKLSEDRAIAVAQVLASMGINRARFVTKGFGKSKPLAPNDSDENRRKNRRTEFVITGGVQ
jgi:VWFA-related protein